MVLRRFGRPTRAPTAVPTRTPLPTFTYQPTPAPTVTPRPTLKPTQMPTVRGIEPGNPFTTRVGAIATPLVLAFVGMVIGALLRVRDSRRAALWRRTKRRHKERVEEITKTLRDHGVAEEEILEALEEEAPPPVEPEYPTALSVVLRACNRVKGMVVNQLWLCFCEVKLYRDPAGNRLVGDAREGLGEVGPDCSDAGFGPGIEARSPLPFYEDPSNAAVGTLSPLEPPTMKTLPQKVRVSLGQAARRSLGGLGESSSPGPVAEASRDAGFAPPAPSRAIRRGRWSDVGPASPNGIDSPQAGFHGQQHLIDGFTPDCGPDRRNKTLSYAKAMHERLKRVPHKKYTILGGGFDPALDQPSEMSRVLPTDDGDYVSAYPLSVNLGQHSVGPTPCEALCPAARAPLDDLMRNKHCGIVRCRDDADPLLKYPIGIRLYFKMLKAMYRAFFWFSLASCFMMATFWYGSAWSGDQKNALLVSDSRAGTLSNADRLNFGMFFFSLGSLGARKVQCSSAEEGEVLNLACPYGRIVSVRAFYGDPEGSCGCPLPQLPDPDSGQCPQAPIFQAAGASGQRVMERCEYVGEGSAATTEGFCLRGSTLFGETCCARDLSQPEGLPRSWAEPDLSALVPQDRPGCASETAQYILQSACLGHEACNFTVEANQTYRFHPREGPAGEPLPCSARDSNISSAHICLESLGGHGNWTACPVGPGGGLQRQLVAYAHCAHDRMTFPLWPGFPRRGTPGLALGEQVDGL